MKTGLAVGDAGEDVSTGGVAARALCSEGKTGGIQTSNRGNRERRPGVRSMDGSEVLVNTVWDDACEDRCSPLLASGLVLTRGPRNSEKETFDWV